MNSTYKTILFVSTTKRNDLCCISAYINPAEQHDPSAKSDFHWQILKCRQIIFEHEEVIASPALDNQVQINIVLSKSFYVTGKIQEFLEKLKMPGHRLQQLTNSIYESCLRYTILAHIAPQWNQVQNYLIQGRKFLETREPLNAIRIEVEVKDDSMYVVLTPTIVKMQGLTLENLELPPALIHEFKSQSMTPIYDITMGAKWVHVLPSMKRGRILTISHDIPKSCPYKTYKDLKRHWKNSYGYRLPESNEEIFYCTINFHPIIRTNYTYPSICLKAAPLQFMGRLDERKIVAAFLTDLAKKMPNVCGNPFKVNGEQGYTIPQSIKQIKENIRPSATLLESHTGLIPKPTQQSEGLKILSPRDTNHSSSRDADILLSTQNSCDVSLTTPVANIVNKNPIHSTQRNLLRPMESSSFTPLNEVADKKVELPIKNSISSNISDILGSKTKGRMSLDRNATLETTEDSTFDRNTMKQAPHKIMAANMARHSQPFTESAFASNASQLASTPGTIKTEFIEPARVTLPQLNPSQQFSKTPLALSYQSAGGTPSLFAAQPIHGSIPSQVPSQPMLSRTHQMIQQATGQTKYTPSFPVPSMPHGARAPETNAAARDKYTPVFAPPAMPSVKSVQCGKAGKSNSGLVGEGYVPVRQGQASMPIAAQSGHTIPKIPTFGMQSGSQSQCVSKVPTFDRQVDSSLPNSTQSKLPAFGSLSAKLPTNTNSKLPGFGSSLTSKSPAATPKNKKPLPFGSQKRSANNSPFPDTDGPSSSSKKPKSRPQLQTNINVEEMARSQTLEKVNTVTLLNWLRGKKIPATTRDTKATLMDLIKKNLGI